MTADVMQAARDLGKPVERIDAIGGRKAVMDLDKAAKR